MPITLGAAGLQIINLFDAATVMNRLINAAGYTQERADVVKGVYNYCQTIFNFPCAFIPCITIAIIPAITNSLTLQDRRGVRSVQNSSLRLMGLIAMPCAVGLIVLAEPSSPCLAATPARTSRLPRGSWPFSALPWCSTASCS